MNTQIKSMEQATYFNEDYGSWGFIGCDSDAYGTQEEAYDAYVSSLCLDDENDGY